MEEELTLTIDELKRLSEPPPRGAPTPGDHAFWAIAMPDPHERPQYYMSIKRLYEEFLDPPISYIDAYHPLVGGAPVFNKTIQDILIDRALYIVVDLSCIRHNVLFEGGFGFGSGMQVIFYFDNENPLRRKYRNELNGFSTMSDLRMAVPPQIQYAIFAQPPQRIPEKASGSHAVEALKLLADWCDKSVHSPGLRLRRRRCCKVHFDDCECEFEMHLSGSPRKGATKYYFARFQEGHKDKEQHVRDFLMRRGIKPVEELSVTVESESPLCQTCFSLRLADRIILDGTSPPLYSRDAAESAFILGMAVAFMRKFPEKSAKIKMLYEEAVGAIGMFAGPRSGWEASNWRDQIDRELDTWV